MLFDGLVLVSQIDLGAFFAMFWHAIAFELPRFLFAVMAVGAVEAAGGGRRTVRRRDYRPTISVLMPGHNEGANLQRAIQGLREQTRNDMQIIVIDDGSSDNMADVGNALKRDGLVDIFVYRGMRSGKSAATNLGLSYCTGDVVIILDIDTSFDRDAIERIVEPLADPRVGAVSGNIAVRNPAASVIARFQAIQYFISISLGRRVSDMLGVLFITSGAFSAFRREALLAIGGCSVGPGEDADLAIKVRRAGWKVRFAPEAWALTDVPEHLLALVNQRLRWSRSLVRVRARKFKPMFNPFQPNFSLIDALGTIDIIWFQAILPASFYIYIVWLFAYFGSFAWTILGAVTCWYMLMSLVTFTVALSVSGHQARPWLLLYVPGYALFNAYILRAVTFTAYLQELIFRSSYRDSYVPRRVSAQVERF